MRGIILIIIVLFAHCTEFTSGTSKSNEMLNAPARINDTDFYLGTMNYKISPRQFDTSYIDTIYAVRTYQDSITFYFKTADFLDNNFRSGLFSQIWETFCINCEYIQKFDSKYTSSNISFTFSSKDSLRYEERNSDKANDIEIQRFFEGIKMQGK